MFSSFLLHQQILTKNKNGKIHENNSGPQLANSTIPLNAKETINTTVDLPKIPSKKPDFHISQISEKTLKVQLLICYVSGKI